MTHPAMKETREVLVLIGSPREKGKSARLGTAVTKRLREHGLKVTFFELSKYPVAACTGCGACNVSGQCCIMGDSWGVLSKHMESCDAFLLVAPVYFAGPTGWLKAALDRCQMYWSRKYLLKEGVPSKRPAHLVVIGEGGDPFGTAPLETICTSALNCANLRITPERTHRFIGVDIEEARVDELTRAVLASVANGEDA